ncbi:MAG: FxsA family protein [Cellvibrionaceae bacterium]
MRVLLVLFIAIPMVEMWLLITVGGVIGALPTIGLVLLTACIGLALLRYQGSETLTRARSKLHSNELPAREIADTLFFAIGGALLLTPGFVTDAIGFACLTPGIRSIIIRFFANNLMRSGKVDIKGFSANNQYQSSRFGKGSQAGDHKIIEGEFEHDIKANGADINKKP